jgi:hypothetical protein
VIGVNLMVTKNNTIVTLHFNDKERGSERLSPHDELHGDDTSGLHRIAPHAVQQQGCLHELVILPSKLLEHGVRHQVDGISAIDEHPWPLVDVASNVQWLQVLAQFLGLLEHNLFGTKAQLSNLLVDSPKLDRHREDDVDIHVDQW